MQFSLMKRTIVFLSLIVFANRLFCQDTFSICAVDSATGEVGSAGASCINGSVIISDVHPGVALFIHRHYIHRQTSSLHEH
jgi:hypothetical protein